MTIRELVQRKNESGYTDEEISELCGIPMEIVREFSVENVANLRYDMYLSLERLLGDTQEAALVREETVYKIHRDGEYTIEDYRNLPEEQRVELIDGRFYVMEAPTFLHQKITGEIYRQIANFIVDRGGSCQPMISPVDVQLDCDDKTMLQPDVAILCDSDKVRRWGVYGAPDFVLEVISPSSRKKDSIKKVEKYEEAGVKEYWIVDPAQKRLVIYRFDSEEFPMICGLEEPVPIGIYDGKLLIQFEAIREWIEQERK